MAKDDAACPSCQSRDLNIEYELIDPTYHTARCRRCGFIAMHPYPSDRFLHDHYKSRELYNAGNEASSYDRAVADRSALLQGLLTRAGITDTTGRSIDFGAGVGIAVAAQKALGFDAAGIETNPSAQAVGREIFGVDIRDMDMKDMPNDLKLFTVFEVLEHIKFPGDFMAEVRGHMAPNGVVAGSVPNYDGMARYVRGKHSIALAWPEHVNQFTRKTLADTLKSAGYEVVYIGFPPPYGVVIKLGLREWLRKGVGEGPFLNVLIQVLTWVKKYIAYPLPNLIAEHTGLLGHGLVFVAINRNA
ncbi:hypothetical protein AEAC466_13315 [Asticcacaulis sp. AC466]|uniref:class I SAM-dependent methyltransferase n=1 Tax=Asticcacaulis sp. AC466 TaxID=1282362 RepID=UPI0003C40CB1|nr:class I SAM-dependent methyltransferase [Asticcacaulis sp. AC466]ESQ83225.1 hypothetical protein AEAC466_13315 [Asticcacaulis sp. AC466]